MSTSNRPIRSWRDMSEREQAVWGVAYAMHPSPGRDAALHADQVIGGLAEFEPPATESPEHRAARLYRGLKLAEFAAWYVVEKQLTRHKSRRPATREEIEEAYRIYVMCSMDYY